MKHPKPIKLSHDERDAWN